MPADSGAKNGFWSTNLLFGRNRYSDTSFWKLQYCISLSFANDRNMPTGIPLDYILFLDIETVPETRDFSQLSPEKQELWAKKTEYQRREEITPEDFYERAGIWAEFGKIVCISVGYFVFRGSGRQF